MTAWLPNLSLHCRSFMQISPLMFAFILLLGVGMSTCAVTWKSRLTKASVCTALANTGDVLVGGIFTLLYYTYFTVVKRALEIFACTMNADGVYSLDADPSITCWTVGTVHAKLVPSAIVSLCGYGIGVPVAIGVVMCKHREAIRRDQGLWLVGRGSINKDNPDWSVRRRFAKLYQV